MIQLALIGQLKGVMTGDCYDWLFFFFSFSSSYKLVGKSAGSWVHIVALAILCKNEIMVSYNYIITCIYMIT